MRSEAIFRSKDIIANRYSLCQAVAKTARLFNNASTDTQSSINQAFERVAKGTEMPILAIFSPEAIVPAQ